MNFYPLLTCGIPQLIPFLENQVHAIVHPSVDVCIQVDTKAIHVQASEFICTFHPQHLSITSIVGKSSSCNHAFKCMPVQPGLYQCKLSLRFWIRSHFLLSASSSNFHYRETRFLQSCIQDRTCAFKFTWMKATFSDLNSYPLSTSSIFQLLLLLEIQVLVLVHLSVFLCNQSSMSVNQVQDSDIIVTSDPQHLPITLFIGKSSSCDIAFKCIPMQPGLYQNKSSPRFWNSQCRKIM